MTMSDSTSAQTQRTPDTRVDPRTGIAWTLIAFDRPELIIEAGDRRSRVSPGRWALWPVQECKR